jgi:hypothetical protein
MQRGGRAWRGSINAVNQFTVGPHNTSFNCGPADINAEYQRFVGADYSSAHRFVHYTQFVQF